MLVLVLAVAFVSQAKANEAEEQAYTQVINERAAKIVGPLGLQDAAQSERVQSLIAGFYRTLRDIHAQRDAESPSSGKSEEAEQVAQLAVRDAHYCFLAQLSVELTSAQVEAVKDGLTYGVAPRTYQVYLEQMPDLKDQDKKAILALLVEAREHAMDGGSADEKHGWFRKYKGKINNYLSKAGYNQ